MATLPYNQLQQLLAEDHRARIDAERTRLDEKALAALPKPPHPRFTQLSRAEIIALQKPQAYLAAKSRTLPIRVAVVIDLAYFNLSSAIALAAAPYTDLSLSQPDRVKVKHNAYVTQDEIQGLLNAQHQLAFTRDTAPEGVALYLDRAQTWIGKAIHLATIPAMFGVSNDGISN